jgi:hypothetical protein
MTRAALQWGSGPVVDVAPSRTSHDGTGYRSTADEHRGFARLSLWVPAAVGVTLATALVGYILYGRGDFSDNLTALLMNLAVLVIQIVFISLVIDRLAKRREQARWERLHPLMARALVRACVDLMRVNSVFTIPESPDIVRTRDFLDLAASSLAILRSEVETLTPTLDIDVQIILRDAQNDLEFLYRSFHSFYLDRLDNVQPDIAYEQYSFFSDHDNWRVLVRSVLSSWSVIAKLDLDPGSDLLPELESVAADRLLGLQLDSGLALRFYETRYDIQDELIRQRGLPYVLMDERGETERVYFVVDYVLLTIVKHTLDAVHA